MFCAIGTAHAATYYVSTAGSDSNPGSSSAPFRHVSKGASVAQAGDTVIVMNGTYDNEQQVATSSGGGMVVTMTNSGTVGNPITIMAQNRGGAILNSANTTTSNTGSYACNAAWTYFDLSYTSYVVIQGFVLENSCINGIRANGNAHDITLRWNEIRNVGNWNNPATTLSPSGMYINSSEYNFTFDGNVFHDIGGGTNVNQQHAIYTAGSNITIINNIFYNQVHGWDIQTAGGHNLTIANNTFAFDNPNRSGDIILWDDGVANSLANVTVENNIFYQPQNYGIVAELDGGGSINGCNMQYNLITLSSLFDSGSTYGGGGVSCSQSNNLTNTDPVFNSPSSYDFHLQSGSPAIDSGANNSYTAVDLEGWGRPVNNVYDRGSYEYHSTVQQPPPTVSLSLAPNPGSVSVNQGSSATASIAATIGGSATFTFSASGLPSGVSASFSPSSCSSSCSSTVTFTASSSAQGSSTAAITGTNGSVSGNAAIAVSVAAIQAPPPPPPPASGDYSTGLVAEWKLNGNTADSANGDNGTLHGGGLWSNGSEQGTKFTTLLLNGLNSYVSAGETPNLEMSSQMSISFWIAERTIPKRSVSQGDTSPRIFAKVYDWDVKLNAGMPQLSAGGSYALANSSIPLGVWTHVVFTFSQGSVTAYINGQQVSLAANTFWSGQTLPTTYNYGAYIGTDSGLLEFFSGDVSDVRLYNRALQSADVWALYSHVTP